MYQETNDVVQKFVKGWESFTALDVSNEVKKVLPTVRHRDIAREVRNLFLASIPDYMDTQIEVTLENGTTCMATLYHPLYDEDVLHLVYPPHRRALKATAPEEEKVTTETLVYEMIKDSGDQGMFAYTIRFKMSDLHDVDAFETQLAINNLLTQNKIKAGDDGLIKVFNGIVFLSAHLKPIGVLADEDEI